MMITKMVTNWQGHRATAAKKNHVEMPEVVLLHPYFKSGHSYDVPSARLLSHVLAVEPGITPMFVREHLKHSSYMGSADVLWTVTSNNAGDSLPLGRCVNLMVAYCNSVEIRD